MNLNTNYKCWLLPHLKKFLNIMKIIYFLLLAGALPIYASSFGQHLSIKKKKISLEHFFKEIKTQTGRNVFFADQSVNKSILVDGDYNNIPLTEALDNALNNLMLEYVIVDKDIVVRKIKRTNNSIEQQKITGRVLDESGNALSGATILVLNTQITAITDANGYFTLSNVVEGSSLQVSFVGYQVLKLKASNNLGNIMMTRTDDSLEEVQVIAFGTQKKVTVTGAISSLDGKDLVKSPSGSIANILAGTMSGISTVQYSGQPGADDPEIYVRGTASLSNERSAPLILVDGVERSFFRMDPNEIENVTVLKDASATAVFGVRGANGVILVTTKRGKSGKATISMSSSMGISQPIRLPKIVGSYEHAMLYNEMQLSDNPNMTPEQLHFSPYALEMFRTGADPIMFPNTNWTETLFKDNSIQRQHNVNISGGTERVRYFASIGNLFQNGMLRKYNENYDPNYKNNRYNYRTNLDIDVTKSTLLKINIGGRSEAVYEPNNDVSVNNIWTEILRAQPFASPGIIDGKLVAISDQYVPHVMRNGFMPYYGKGYRHITNNTSNLDLVLNQKLDFITKGLSIETKGAYNTSYSVSKTRASSIETYTPIYISTINNPTLPITDPTFDKTIVYRQSGANNELSYGESYGKARDWYFDFSVRYDKAINDHKVGGLLLYNMSRSYYPAAYTDIPEGYIGLVGRLTYSFKNKYLFDINAGYNGSENFMSGRRYGFFPAVSGGWILSEEKFMKDLSFVDLLKIRGSYGKVGNDNLSSSSRFLYLPDSYNANSGGYYFGENISTVFPGVQELMLGNPLVTWETATKYNFGLDLAFFANRFTLTGDLFFENRNDILIQQNTIPSVVAATLPAVNIGKVDNKGYELSFGWNDKTAGEFRYWTKVNLSFSRNKIIYKDEIPQTEDYLVETGRPTGMTKGYKFDRFFEEGDFNTDGTVKTEIPQHPGGGFKPGDLMLKDLNGDNIIDGNDMTYFGYSENPEYILGWNFGVEYKNFDLSATFTAATNVSRRFEEDYTRPFNTGSAPLLQFMADQRWTPEKGQSATFPRFTNSNRGYNSLVSDFWVKDASYIRLKNFELGYSLKGNVLQRIGIQKLRVYTNGYNLLTFDKLKFIDPESKVGSRNRYPNSRIINFGLNVNF
jgi:TonB-linked SusC/RagA family outer membrane protein